MKMKGPKKDKTKKTVVSKKGAVTKAKSRLVSKEKVLVVAQEIKYARLLSGNEKHTRDRVLKSLKKWLTNCFEKGYEFKEEDFTRVWKGLFYAVWMSDKPLIQEELCDSIAGILDLFPADQLRSALLMVRAGLRTLATEWYGIDQHRMDKFLMLARRYLRGSLRCLRRCEWSLESCEKYAKMLAGSDGIFALKTPHYARNASSLQHHIVDCFLEELAKVSKGAVPGHSVAALVQPFIAYTCGGAQAALCAAARRLLSGLLRQSEAGLQYDARTAAWKRMGCPAGGPDALEPISDDDIRSDLEDLEDAGDEDDWLNKPLDPRAGRVDVELPLLAVPAGDVAARLRARLPAASPKAQRRIRICIERFERLAKGEYPLRVPAPDSPDLVVTSTKKMARALRALETKLKSDADELKLRGLSRRHRKRLLRKTRLGHSIVEDVETLRKPHRERPKNGEWLVESTSSDARHKQTNKDTCNKENQSKKDKKSEDKSRKRKLDYPKCAKHGDVKKIKLDDRKVKRDKVDNSCTSVKEGKKKMKDSTQKYTNNPNKRATETRQLPKRVDKKPVIEDKKAKIVADEKKKKKEKVESPKVLTNKLRTFSKHHLKEKDVFEKSKRFETPKRVKFELKNNSMQKPVDYYKSVKQSPSIPFDSSKKPTKTNLKPSTPSPINPFFKKKLRMKH